MSPSSLTQLYLKALDAIKLASTDVYSAIAATLKPPFGELRLQVTQKVFEDEPRVHSA